MEQLMIEFATLHGMRYVDYFINIGGHVVFKCYDKHNKEKWYTVIQWSPFKCQPWT